MRKRYTGIPVCTGFRSTRYIIPVFFPDIDIEFVIYHTGIENYHTGILMKYRYFSKWPTPIVVIVGVYVMYDCALL